MSLRIRHLRLRATTVNGEYGTDLAFPDGLVLLNLHNTRGKSTALKGIIYALGMERMFGQVNSPPLTPAMTTGLKDDGKEWAVVESWVYLEIENSQGTRVTLRRKVSGKGGQDTKVVDVFEGAILDDPSLTIQPTPYFARDPGSATHERGIALWLAGFIGWELPEVIRHDGSFGPLYIECLLSLFFIEQSQGWTSIQAVTPRIFGIRQVEKKAVEFVLNLEASRADSEREKVNEREEFLRKSWTERRNRMEVIARSIKGTLRNMPSAPQAQWPPSPAAYLEVFQDGSELSLEEAIISDDELLKQLDDVDIPTADEAAAEISEQLQQLYLALRDAESVGASLEEDYSMESTNLSALSSRLATVEEDLIRNKDLKKLNALGAVATLPISHGECPTCHQHIEDTLLSQKLEYSVMGLEENIAYLTSQRQTLKSMEARTEGAISALERRKSAVVAYASDIRARIRTLKKTLISAGIAPSEAAVRERVVVDERLQARKAGANALAEVLSGFSDLSTEWIAIQTARKSIKDVTKSEGDLRKLRGLSNNFKNALVEFGFESFPMEAVVMDTASYRPKREGFDLAYAVSASDNVRIIAAYISSLLETARVEPTNHPGFLLLDEPRQQNMQWADFSKILARLSNSANFGQQVIVATSDNPEAIAGLAGQVPCTRLDVDFDEWLLRPLVPKLEATREMVSDGEAGDLAPGDTKAED